MLGMMSFSHCLRKASLSKLGSAFRISVNTADISVLEKRPPVGTMGIGNTVQNNKLSRCLYTFHCTTKHDLKLKKM